jgi:hypothetical protein
MQQNQSGLFQNSNNNINQLETQNVSSFFGQDIVDLDISDVDLSYTNYENCSFKNCTFQRVNITSGTFDKCFFENVNFNECELSGTEFTNSKLIGSNFSECRMHHSTFKSDNIYKTKFINSDTGFSLFEDSELKKSKFYLSNLNNCKFININFHKMVVVDCITRDISIIDPIDLLWARELVSEILLQCSNGHIKKERLALLIRYKKEMCWEEWRKYAEDEEKVIAEWVKTCFSDYPQSNLLKALNNEIQITNI